MAAPVTRQFVAMAAAAISGKMMEVREESVE
jgi:hypothetical protein